MYLKFVVLVSAITFMSCSRFDIKLRTKPVLVKKNDLVISNTQNNPYAFTKENELLKINYKIVLKNIGNDTKMINLTESYISANNENSKLNCEHLIKQKQNFELAPNEMATIACQAKITPNNNNNLKLKDTDLVLGVNFMPDLTLNFNYRVFAEEF